MTRARVVRQVTEFLCDPELYCKRPDFFKGTCLEALLIKIKEVKSLPDPTKSTMLALSLYIIYIHTYIL